MTNERLQKIEDKIAQGPFQDSWDSLEAYTVPDWYSNGKFGIFIHWGPYCVPAFGNEWYPRRMYDQNSREFQHHLESYGPHNEFGYKDFIPMFKAEKFDAQAWAQLFQEAGARFVVPVAEHHDGFQMYASELSRWNAAQMGPQRDVVGELAEAVQAAGMVFGVSSHRAEHWWYMGEGRKFDSDVNDPTYEDFYGPAHGDRPRDNYLENPPSEAFLQDWLLRCCELVDKYQPRLVWFDWWIMNLAFKPYLKKFAAYLYNSAAEWGEGAAINYKYDAYPTGTAVFDIERGQIKGMRGLLWQNDTSVSKNSWGYIEGHDYKNARDIIGDLIDVVSKNGALLLNVGPKADGTIPEPEQQMLREIGRWLAVHGEAIYNTQAWTIFGEGPTQIQEGAFTDTKRTQFTSEDIRFTRKDHTLYAHVMAWPQDGTVRIKSLGKRSPDSWKPIQKITVLGKSDELTWSQEAEALVVQLGDVVATDYPFVFVIAA